MSRKPGSMYRYPVGQATTRREYMGGVPNSRITQFDMGNRRDEFPIEFALISEEPQQIRHNSLEAGRISANRVLDKGAGAANYHLRVCVYPHVVLRENKQATGAGADRVSQGMRASYGKNVSTAARVNRKQVIMKVGVHPQHVVLAKKALRKAAMKFAAPFSIQVIRGEKLIN